MSYSNGATGFGPPAPITNGLTNGHLEGHFELLPQSAASSTSLGYDSPGSSVDDPARHGPHLNGANGHSPKVLYKVPATVPIVKRLFGKLFVAAGVEGDITRSFEIPDHVLRKHPARQLICKITDLTTEYILICEQTLENQIEELREVGVEVLPTTMHTEYRHIVQGLINRTENFTWGHVISFLQFAVAFAVYVYRKGMHRAVSSIEAWTIEVIEEDLGKFFMENKGWEGYADYVESLVRRQKKIIQARKAHPDHNVEDPTIWKGVAVGVVAVGIGTAFALREFFS